VPLYEYQCLGCHTAFELLLRAGDTPVCPACAGSDLRKLMSAATVGRTATDAPEPATSAGACGRCGDPRGPGACAFD